MNTHVKIPKGWYRIRPGSKVCIGDRWKGPATRRWLTIDGELFTQVPCKNDECIIRRRKKVRK
jgi:hypothetical protein